MRRPVRSGREAKLCGPDIVSLSALASTAVLLAQELPQLLNGLP